MTELLSVGASIHINDEAEFAAQVNDAFKEYDSVLALARLPLANSPLVAPLLVLDNVSPTAEERGLALRLIIRWAVERLAPAPINYPFGTERPFDDPTWSDSRWWRYNILRHRYLEPLHPDQFVEGGRYTETLIALTGIPSTDTFFDERNRAIREVARWLRQQWVSEQANGELQRLALGEVHRQLEKQSAASQLLAIAATFDDVFPSQLLRQMAAAERMETFDAALAWLIQNRLLLSGDGGALLSISALMQRDLYARQLANKVQRRHRQIAEWYLANQNIVAAVRHLQKGGQWQEAAQTLLRSADDLVMELQSRELGSLLQLFSAHLLPADLWREVQIRLSDLLALTGATEDAVAACRRALKATDQPSQQARIYRRMGKLYEAHNQLHALNYYQQAVECFAANDLELIDLLKDRAWIYIMREEWQSATRDLTLALAQTSSSAVQQRANIYDAFSYLYGRQQQYMDAIQYARQALALREERGDILRVADSFINLGLLYMRMGEYANALAAHADGLRVYRQIDNRPKIATALLNIGMAYHLDKRLKEAISSYGESLLLCQEIGLPLVESKAHSNLVEAYLDAGQQERARQHWQQGYALALEKGFADEISYYEELRAKSSFLGESTNEATQPDLPSTQSTPTALFSSLSPDEQSIMHFASQRGQVSASDLIDELHLSRATATRRLAGLVEKGVLQAEGKGRGSYYRPVTPLKAADKQISSGSQQQENLPLTVEQIRAALSNHRHELTRRYSIEALGIVEPNVPQLPGSTVVVRFQQLPNLVSYLELKSQLGTLLHAQVDLLLDAPHQPQAQPLASVFWL